MYGLNVPASQGLRNKGHVHIFNCRGTLRPSSVLIPHSQQSGFVRIPHNSVSGASNCWLSAFPFAKVAGGTAAVVFLRHRVQKSRKKVCTACTKDPVSPEEDDPLRKDLEAFLRAQRADPPCTDPLGGELTAYNDNPFDLFFIAVFRLVMSGVARWQSPQPFWGSGAYDGLLEVSHAMQWKKTLQETEDSSMSVIEGLLPEEGRERFRSSLKPDKFGTEINAWITKAFFPFMVGECEIEGRTSEDVPRIPKGETWNCAIKIEKCRWLEKSGCVGMCVGLCKRPMQRMFGNVLGMPLSMEPQLEDLSCTMVFGKDPESWEKDELRNQPCFATCATASKGKDSACPKLR